MTLFLEIRIRDFVISILEENESFEGLILAQSDKPLHSRS